MFKSLLNNRQMHVRFVKFFIVGGTGYVVGFLSFNILKLVLSPNNAFSGCFLLSLAAHYSLNRFWALKSHRSDTLRQLIEYLAAAAVCYGISFSTFKFLNVSLGLNLMWSQALSQPPATLFTFFVLNFWVFKHKPTEGFSS